MKQLLTKSHFCYEVKVIRGWRHPLESNHWNQAVKISVDCDVMWVGGKRFIQRRTVTYVRSTSTSTSTYRLSSDDVWWGNSYTHLLLSLQRFPRSTGPGSANFDDLLHRINTLNEHNRPSAPYLESPGVSWPKVQSDQASPDEAFTNSFPGNHGPNALPLVDRRNKPRSRLPSDALREVRVPSDLVDRFAQAASENTSRKNIETCGNLWGVREHGVYVVTHVLIPKQKGTDSYCEDLDEGDVAELAISENLIQLGWIHTHPSQTAFLSSVDMHMQHGYQIMLPEAIAIVLAPKFNDVGFFRLNNYGMEMIGQCREGTNFHVHDESYPLFERIEGGVVIDGQKETKLEDFRLRW